MTGPDRERLSPCVCSTLRMVSRAVTQLYDDILRPSGLRVTQFSILGAIARLGTRRNGCQGATGRDATPRDPQLQRIAPLTARSGLGPGASLGILGRTTLMISRKCTEGGIAWYQMQHARVSMLDQDPGGQLEALRAAAARSCPPPRR